MNRLIHGNSRKGLLPDRLWAIESSLVGQNRNANGGVAELDRIRIPISASLSN
jgi:hypothetical protein